MPIAVQSTYSGPGATLANYQKWLALVGATAGGPHPDPDCLFHWMAETISGLFVTDVWHSRERSDHFEFTVGRAASIEAGLPEPQKMFFWLSNWLRERQF
jgi:hypothetical protein